MVNNLFFSSVHHTMSLYLCINGFLIRRLCTLLFNMSIQTTTVKHEYNVLSICFVISYFYSIAYFIFVILFSTSLWPACCCNNWISPVCGSIKFYLALFCLTARFITFRGPWKHFISVVVIFCSAGVVKLMKLFSCLQCVELSQPTYKCYIRWTAHKIREPQTEISGISSWIINHWI